MYGHNYPTQYISCKSSIQLLTTLTTVLLINQIDA